MTDRVTPTVVQAHVTQRRTALVMRQWQDKATTDLDRAFCLECCYAEAGDALRAIQEGDAENARRFTRNAAYWANRATEARTW